MHPYLFPVGLGGLPTFAPGGDPTRDAKEYWNHTRRALLRTKIDRIGLGGYLHLVENYPDFVEYIEKISNEFRTIRDLHTEGSPSTIGAKVAVLHSWGKLRSWTLSGHFHETYMNDLIHINEALSGLPVDVDYISFEDAVKIDLSKYKIIINAGAAGTAWSGGDNWNNPILEEILSKWVFEGGTFIGVNEPSAIEGYDTAFRLANILGVDKNTVDKICHGKWSYELTTIDKLIPEGAYIPKRCRVHLTDGKAKVILEKDGDPVFTVNDFGKGKGIYLSTFETTPINNRLLFNIILYAAGLPMDENYTTDNANTECAYFASSRKLIVINNSDSKQSTSVKTESGVYKFEDIEPFDTVIKQL